MFFESQTYKKGSQILDYVINQQKNLMAVKVQDEGSELCEIIFINLKDKSILNDKLYPIWNEFDISFTPDGKGLTYTQMSTSDPNGIELLKNSKSKLHLLGTDPKNDKVLGSAEDYPELNILPERFPVVNFSNDNQYIILFLGAATNYSQGAFIAESKDLNKNKIPWKQLLKADDKISEIATFGNQLFFRSFKKDPNFIIGVTDIRKPDFENAKILVSAKNGTITGMTSTKNYLVYSESDGISQNLYRLDPVTFQTQKIETPGGINTSAALNSKENDELVIRNSNWLSPKHLLEYDARQNSKALKSKWMNTSNFYDYTKDFTIQEIEIKGHDGVMVPLSIIYPKNIKKDGSTYCYVTGYGSYGYSFTPFFLGEEMAFLQHGGMIAIAHVRGGGEKGEAWHQAGMKKTKPNTWKDFISSAEYLIKEGYTSPGKLIGEGASAGGILIGRAMTERPDLFAVAVNNVGFTQTLRSEATANGDNHIPEMGTIKNEDDISAIIEMDAQSKINKGVSYPAVLNITGINDSRVVPWMAGKFAAALQNNSTSGKPVFLRVNYKGAHSANDISDSQQQLADIFSFAFWQTGHPDFQVN